MRLSVRVLLGFLPLIAPGQPGGQVPANGKIVTVAEARALDAEGVSLAAAGNLPQAIEHFRHALLLAPEFPDAHYHLGMAHDRAGQTDEAMAEFEQALRLREDLLQARYLLAGCCRKRGDFEGEQRLLAIIVNSAPTFAEARYNYGLGLQRAEMPAEAVGQLRAAADAEPENPRYILALGIALADRDQTEAVTVLRRAVRLSPASAEAHYNLALAIASGGDNAGAVPEFRAAIRLNPEHGAARRALGIALMREDRMRESAVELRRACEIGPADAEAANNLGLVLLRMGAIEEAIAALERAARLNPKLIKAQFNLAQAYQRARRPADARDATRRAAALTAEQRSLGRAMVLVQSGRQRLASGDLSGALQSLRDAVIESPAFAEAHLELGRAVLDSSADPDEAIREFKTAWSLDPERADVHYQLGLALLKTGARPKALDEFKAALSMAPCRVEMMRALGRLAWESGDRATAARQFRRILAWNPDDAEARDLLRKARDSM